MRKFYGREEELGKLEALVLVYAGELDPAVEADGFFDYLVPAEKLF